MPQHCTLSFMNDWFSHLTAGVLTDGDHAVLLWMDHSQVVRLRPAHHGRLDLIVPHAPEAAVPPAAAAFLVRDAPPGVQHVPARKQDRCRLAAWSKPRDLVRPALHVMKPQLVQHSSTCKQNRCFLAAYSEHRELLRPPLYVMHHQWFGMAPLASNATVGMCTGYCW